MAGYQIFSLGDQGVTLSLGNTINRNDHKKIMSMKEWVEQHSFQGLLDIVVAYSSITLLYDAFIVCKENGGGSAFSFVKERLADAFRQSNSAWQNEGNLIRIPVCYDESFALDSKFISESKGISQEEIIALHTGRTYHVYVIGFLPGFPYMAKVDDQLVVPRKEKPRIKVEAGSVGVAGVQTGIYSFASPGGWQIIGRTPVTLFNKNDNPPVKLEAGATVEFYAITKKEFEKVINPSSVI